MVVRAIAPRSRRNTGARRLGRSALALACLLLATPLLKPVTAAESGGEEPTDAEKRELRRLEPSAPDYRTPRAGEGFRTEVFGRPVAVAPRDRRSTSAWDLGAMAWLPAPEGRALLPFGALYFWRRADEQHFFRGTVAVIDNDLVYAHALASGSPFELVLGLESRTEPTASSERVDGERIDAEQTLYGRVQGEVGLGYRRQLEPGFGGLVFRDGVDPQAPDNMFSLSLTAEPQYLYFADGKDSDPRFVAPQDTFALDGRLAMRWDALERNLLDLAHHGMAVGFDGTWGWRANWEDWGIDAARRAGRGRSPKLLQGYGVVAAGVPGVETERHRLLGSLHAGIGEDLDRFSAPRIGGGPGGHEFLSLARPILPGASVSEFHPHRYAVAIAEYRYELFFFGYVGARGSLGFLDRERLGGDGRIRQENDVLHSVGTTLTTGFLFETRLQVDYNYNFDVIRERKRGANEIVLHLSRSF